MKSYIDPNIDRKRSGLTEHLAKMPVISGDVPSFSLVEFNVTELCNRVCEFCPRADPKVYPNRNEFMELALYEKIMKELAAFGYSGKVLYSAFGEPLLHKQLEDMIRMTKKYCPASRVESVTNGDFLSVERLRSLFDAGLDTILISMYDGPEQLDYFKAMTAEAGLAGDQAVFRIRYLPPEEHYGITLSNRAGMVDLSEAGLEKVTEPIKERCLYPHYELMIDFDGKVLMCPHDWGKRIEAGNLNENTVLEVWTSPALTAARKRLAAADRDFTPCNMCDVKGALMGEDHFQHWQHYYQIHDSDDNE